MGKQIKKQRKGPPQQHTRYKDIHPQKQQIQEEQEDEHRMDKKAMLTMPPAQQLTFLKDTLQKILAQPEEQVIMV